MMSTANSITVEDICKAVERFWAVFLSKSEDELNAFYGPGSTVFQVAMGRSEPGRLGAMRRAREYFNSDTKMDVKVSPVDVVLCGPDTGVACYTFQFSAMSR